MSFASRFRAFIAVRALRVLVLVMLVGAVTSLSSCANSMNEVLSGTWTGPDNRTDGSVYTSTVMLTQDAAAVTGTVVTKTATATVYTASISGTYSAPTFSFTIKATPGSVVGSANCAFSFSGTATFSSAGNGTTGPTRTLTGLYGGPTTGCPTATVNDTFTWSLDTN